MFKSTKIVSLAVNDIIEAKQWYSRILNKEPLYDSPIVVLFQIGETTLSLNPNRDNSLLDSGRTIVYWNVDDFEESYQLLIKNGAKPQSGIGTFKGIKTAKLIDPFGNIIGIAGEASEKKTGSLEKQPSESAMTVAFCRAFAVHDSREELKGKDYLAEIFLAEDQKKTIKDPAAREWIHKKMFLFGIYEYFIARTVFIDEIMADSLKKNIPQIVFLGAGYDTRTYRFNSLIKDTRIFELDIEPTQKNKREALMKNSVPVPGQLTYVTINFEKDSISDVLVKSGYDKDKKTLFIWEGVIYYLTDEIVDNVLEQVRSIATAGSILCFDYMADSSDMKNRYGVKESLESMKSSYSAEKFQYFIQEGEIESFLVKRGYKITDHFNAEEIEKKFLSLKDGTIACKIAAYFCFALAEVAK